MKTKKNPGIISSHFHLFWIFILYMESTISEWKPQKSVWKYVIKIPTGLYPM